MGLKVNLGCGPVYVSDPGWVNLDYSPSSRDVKRANLLGRLPFSDNSVELVYSSHFIEHVPRARVPDLLKECFRVLVPGGCLRLVVPDFENQCAEYLKMRKLQEHEKADYLIVEIIDQCIRNKPGGELGRLLREFQISDSVEARLLGDYVHDRNGEVERKESNRAGRWRRAISEPHRIPFLLRSRLVRAWIKACVRLLPPAFREQNISLAGVGERHQWLWDFHQLHEALTESGFRNVQKRTAETSHLAEFPFYPLDIDNKGRPRKGLCSLYLEAIKPAQDDIRP